MLVYDEEYPGKTQYFFKEAKEKQEARDYEIRQVFMEDLENIAISSDFN